MKRILIAEDERELITLYRLMLKGGEYEFIEAFDGATAVELYRQHHPDLVLMDIKMPVKTGDVAIKEILEVDPKAQIVAITAYRYSEEELGVPVLRKGFTPAELSSVVQKVLAG